MPFIGFAFTDRALDFLESLPPKIRKQVAKRAKSLHLNPHPKSSKLLKGIMAIEGDIVYRERSGDYRILYVVRSNPDEIIILDIGHRKDIYNMTKAKTEPADEMRMKESDFDSIMAKALGAQASENTDEPKRRSAYPPKRKVK